MVQTSFKRLVKKVYAVKFTNLIIYCKNDSCQVTKCLFCKWQISLTAAIIRLLEWIVDKVSNIKVTVLKNCKWQLSNVKISWKLMWKVNRNIFPWQRKRCKYRKTISLSMIFFSIDLWTTWASSLFLHLTAVTCKFYELSF